MSRRKPTGPPPPRRRTAERASTTKRVLTHVVLGAYSLFAVGPIVITLFASLKSEPSFFSSPASFPTHLFFSNYTQAWDQGDLLVAFGNSVLVTVSAVLVSGLTGAMAAYAVVRLRARHAGAIQAYFLSGLVVPGVVILIPLFILVAKLRLVGTIGSIILPYCALTLPLSFLMFVNFFRTVPFEIAEASYLDGCSHFRTFWSIELPLVRPAIATVVILNGVFVWNDFLLPLVVETKSDLYTLPVAIISFFGTYSTSYGLVFASVILASAPMIVLYIVLNRLFVQGITSGAIK
jgi:raffinose/stachyose/melibiose transport system permease protein